MKKVIYSFLLLMGVFYGCKKNTVTKQPDPVIVAPEKQDSIYFVFVNRIGYKNDSVSVGSGNMRYLFAVDIETGYYNIKTNKSLTNDVIYARTGGFKLKDSIMQNSYPCYINSQYNLQVSFYWNCQNGNSTTRVRNLTYQLNTVGNDTVKAKGSKIIKFVWPDDTASGKFVKTYDQP